MTLDPATGYHRGPCRENSSASEADPTERDGLRRSLARYQMPLYEYQCDACGHGFEHIQKFSDPLLTVCPKCEGMLRKLVSSPAIQFKGTGWYVTDYAKKGAGDTAASEAEKSSDGKDATSDKTAKSDKTDKTKSGASTSSSDSSKKASKSSTGSSSSTS